MQQTPSMSTLGRQDDTPRSSMNHPAIPQPVIKLNGQSQKRLSFGDFNQLFEQSTSSRQFANHAFGESRDSDIIIQGSKYREERGTNISRQRIDNGDISHLNQPGPLKAITGTTLQFQPRVNTKKVLKNKSYSNSSEEIVQNINRAQSQKSVGTKMANFQ